MYAPAGGLAVTGGTHTAAKASRQPGVAPHTTPTTAPTPQTAR
jgi:hypothetical protein